MIRTVGTRRRYPKRRPPARSRATVCGVVASARTGVTLVAIAGMLAALAACGSSSSGNPAAGSPAPAAVPAALLKPIPAPAGGDCPAVVLTTLARVLQRIYNEGVVSEEVLAARDLIKRNAMLHEAVEHGDAGAARRRRRTPAGDQTHEAPARGAQRTRAGQRRRSGGGAAAGQAHRRAREGDRRLRGDPLQRPQLRQRGQGHHPGPGGGPRRRRRCRRATPRWARASCTASAS